MGKQAGSSIVWQAAQSMWGRGNGFTEKNVTLASCFKTEEVWVWVWVWVWVCKSLK